MNMEACAAVVEDLRRRRVGRKLAKCPTHLICCEPEHNAMVSNAYNITPRTSIAHILAKCPRVAADFIYLFLLRYIY
jgi:hypothetical protein